MEKIKILRDKTGAGIVDCKKALEESGNDIDKAIEILRKKGIAKAAKRGERDASEGIILVEASSDAKKGYIIEINSETDFVARNEKFQALATSILDKVKDNEPSDLDALHELSLGEQSVKDSIDNLSGVIGEKLVLNRFKILKSEGTVAAYSHMGGRIGVLVALDVEGAEGLAKNMAMHIAAANPKYLTSDEVPAEEVEKEKSIYKEQLAKEGKPENIMDKIIEGKINKYFEDVCLMNQEYIMDDSKKIKDVLGNINISEFVRYSL